MRILFLTNNTVSAPLSLWLESGDGGSCDVSVLERRIGTADIEALNPAFVISYSYKHIVTAQVLAMMPGRFINLHISLLPFNRGADPNVWSFLEDTPKGVSIHLMDAGVDTGPILVQKRVCFDAHAETLGRSYDCLQREIQILFREHWQRIRAGSIVPQAQEGAGTLHRARDFAQIKHLLLRDDGYEVTIDDLKRRYAALPLPQRSVDSPRG